MIHIIVTKLLSAQTGEFTKTFTKRADCQSDSKKKKQPIKKGIYESTETSMII